MTHRAALAILAVMCVFTTCAGAETITLRSLLDEMVDPDAVARWPVPEFTVKQASSYDRKTVAPDQPGWFANNDGGGFVRAEKISGREEHVLMEADGPGAIVRLFVTSPDAHGAKLKIYLDHDLNPVMLWDSINLADSDFKMGEPLVLPHPAPLGHGGSTMYLPIPYAKHCKVTIEESNYDHPMTRYFHVDYRTYPAGAEVKTFSRVIFDEAKDAIGKVNQLLKEPDRRSRKAGLQLDEVVQPEAEVSLNLPDGSRAIRNLWIKFAEELSPMQREQALRSVVLRGDFDDDANAIWCPIGDFIGSGAGGREVRTWMRSVDEKGQATMRWTMPYRDHAKLSVLNLGHLPVHVTISADTDEWKWDNRSMHFHATWHQQVRIPARPYRDWNLVSVTGKGKLIGDVMSVFNTAPAWYGEGDEKIWVDGESFPSHMGTGTEDYYNASWAPNPVFHGPFSSHPRIDQSASLGQNVYTRARSLDAIPFTKSLQFDFEILTWKDFPVDYATTAYWYALPGAKSNIEAQPDEARRPVPTIAPPMAIQGALECETMKIINSSPGLVTENQDMAWGTGQWSANAHLLIRGTKVGDYVELEIPATSDKPQRLTLFATRANDYGTLKFTINGSPTGENGFDGYTLKPTPGAEIPLGIFTAKDGKFILRAEVVGANPKCVGMKFFAGLDAVVLSGE